MRLCLSLDLLSQTVLVRANDIELKVFLGPKQVALHTRCWDAGEDLEHPAHRQRALEQKHVVRALPEGLTHMGEIGRAYFKILAASRRSIRREILRLTFLCEVFGEKETSLAMSQVMQTGHVGSEYVEYVLRYKRRLTPQPAPLRLGKPELDALSFAEPDLSGYDQLAAPVKMLDPGPLPAPSEDENHEDR